MKKLILSLVTILIPCIVFIVACSDTKQPNAKNTPTLDSTAMVARGEYIVKTSGCDDCHSPKRMGANGPELIPELRLSGFQQNSVLPEVDAKSVQKGWMLFAPDLTAAVGPWGISYAANLTPDSTGLGAWKEENFFRAVREGKSKGLAGNRSLLPPMPWFNIAKMTDEDIRSIFVYLKTIKPVHNVVPAPVPPTEVK
jgi:mono/diheme cytochrome c family protein